MEYTGTETQLDPRNYAQTAAGSERSRCDLSNVRGRLEECVKRANDLGAGARAIADSIVGSRPEATTGGLAERPVESSLSQLVDDLSVALGRIDSNLGRL